MKIIALEGQSFLDIAIQGGTLESIFQKDKTISITATPEIGNSYEVEIINVPRANYYKNNLILPATGMSDEDIANQDGGIGVMAIGTTFIVR